MEDRRPGRIGWAWKKEERDFPGRPAAESPPAKRRRHRFIP